LAVEGNRGKKIATETVKKGSVADFGEKQLCLVVSRLRENKKKIKPTESRGGGMGEK